MAQTLPAANDSIESVSLAADKELKSVKEEENAQLGNLSTGSEKPILSNENDKHDTSIVSTKVVSPQSTALATPPEYPPLVIESAGKPSRYAFVAKLIEVSSGAKQVRNSTNSEVIMNYQEAREFFAKANNSQDLDKINMFLNMAIGKMYSAIRLSTSTSFGDEKAKKDYEQKLKSMDALSDAYNRIAEEKNAQNKAKIVQEQITKHNAAAEVYSKNNNYNAAKNEIDISYNLLKTSIELLRGGDTLTRSLSFANTEEEYHYEKDRNDTHFMLVNLLVNSKLEGKPQKFKDQIFDMTEKATLLQQNAIESFKRGEHKEAVTLLEESTSILVKAIRMGGIFIPSA